MGALRPAGPRRPDIPRGWWGASWTVPGVRRSSTARPAARHSWNSIRNAGVSWHVQALFRSRHGTATASSYADIPEHDGAESAAAESAAAESAAAESAAAESAAAESAATGHAGA